MDVIQSAPQGRHLLAPLSRYKEESKAHMVLRLRLSSVGLRSNASNNYKAVNAQPMNLVSSIWV